MTPNALVPAAVAVLVAFSLYRRFRRLFGRQRVQPMALKFRVAVLIVAGIFVLLRAVVDPASLMAAAAAAAAAGVALAFVGLAWTRFEATAQGRYYTPHSGLGLALSALLIGRLAYRFVVLYPALQSNPGAASGNPFQGLEHNPITSATLVLFLAYYATFYIGVLRRTAVLEPPREPAGPSFPS